MGEVLEFVRTNCLEGGMSPNTTDPLFLQFRIMSGNEAIYSIVAKNIRKYLNNYLLPAKYGKGGDIISPDPQDKDNYSGNGKNKHYNNVVFADLRDLKGKVIIVLKDHPDFLENTKNQIYMN